MKYKNETEIKNDLDEQEIEEFLSELDDTNNDLANLIDTQKIQGNVQRIKNYVIELNKLLSHSNEELEEKVKALFATNPKCFSALITLAALRNNNESKIIINKKMKTINDDLFKSPADVMEFLETSKIITWFTNNEISDLLPLVYGIEIGMDTNARKNRSGKNWEEAINYLINQELNNNPQWIIKEQETLYIHELGNKKFDFVITNPANHQHVVIESTFYNSQDSKVNETIRSYLGLYQKIKQYHPDYHFLWVVNGKGIKKTFSKIYKENSELKHFITNPHRLGKQIKLKLKD